MGALHSQKCFQAVQYQRKTCFPISCFVVFLSLCWTRIVIFGYLIKVDLFCHTLSHFFHIRNSCIHTAYCPRLFSEATGHCLDARAYTSLSGYCMKPRLRPRFIQTLARLRIQAAPFSETNLALQRYALTLIMQFDLVHILFHISPFPNAVLIQLWNLYCCHLPKWWQPSRSK